MGENLALNIESKGFPVTVYNRTAERTRRFAERLNRAAQIIPTYSVDEFLDSLEASHRILMMVRAGQAVDEEIGRAHV